jgi:hypothetical protein
MANHNNAYSTTARVKDGGLHLMPPSVILNSAVQDARTSTSMTIIAKMHVTTAQAKYASAVVTRSSRLSKAFTEHSDH